MANAQSKAPWDGMTLSQKVEWVQYIALFPALTVMVFIRRKVGFRMLKPSALLILTAILWVLSGFAGNLSTSSTTKDGFVLGGYALAFLAMGAYQRWQRWKELTSGVRWHSYSSGISYLEMLPLPAWLLNHRRVYRYLDPLVCYLVSFLVMLVSRPLGIWIFVATLFMAIFEQARYEKALDRDLDILDSMFEAEIQQETVDIFRDGQPETQEQKQRSLEETAGIPTGVSADIEAQIAKRRARKAAPDNLAVAVVEEQNVQ